VGRLSVAKLYCELVDLVTVFIFVAVSGPIVNVGGKATGTGTYSCIAGVLCTVTVTCHTRVQINCQVHILTLLKCHEFVIFGRMLKTENWGPGSASN